jgi:hypothetical protein
MLYRDGGDAWIDEDCPTDSFPMAHANHAAEASANRFSAAGGVGSTPRVDGWRRVRPRHAPQLRDAASLPPWGRTSPPCPTPHPGKAARSAAIPMKGAIVPSALGVDIGCGMVGR